MPGVTSKGWPYHTETDSVAAWDEVSQQLAEKLDSLPVLAAGSRSHTTANGWNSFTVTFPAGRFTAAPVVVVSVGISSASGIPLAGATSVTKDGCTVNVQHNAVIGVTVSWIAVQS